MNTLHVEERCMYIHYTISMEHQLGSFLDLLGSFPILSFLLSCIPNS